MEITIDGSGRVVVPKKIRDQLNITPGEKLEIGVASGGIYLKKLWSQSTLVKKQGVWIHHGSEKSKIDIADFINAERGRRSVDSGGQTDNS